MIKVDLPAGYHQLRPDDHVGWELGDEYLVHREEQWYTTSFSINDLHQVGLVAVFRRPIKLGLWRGLKVALRKAKEALFKRFGKKSAIC